MRTRRFFQKTDRKITINGSDTAGYDKSKVECFNCHKLGHFAREYRGPKNQDSRNWNQDNSRRTINVEETSSKAMLAIERDGFDWSYMADDEVPTNMALMAFSDSKEYRSGFGVQCLHVDKTLTFLAKKVVRFRSREKPKEDTFSLTLLKIYNYDEVLSRLARYINLDDPSKIRLTSHNCWFIEKLKREPIKYRGVGHLSNMLTLYTRVKFSIQYMKRAIIKKAKFDISELNTIKSAKSSLFPVLFGHAVDDDLLHPHHSDRIYEAYMKIVSRLAILVDDNKADIKTISIDDLYNNFKIVEQDVKKSVGASSGAQNLAFMNYPSTSSTNDVNTANPAYEVSTVSPNINTACPQVSTTNFSDNTVLLAAGPIFRC
ncbi:ribonuclease H-like domain-containing protein [Tanacetum coccineum]